MAKASRLTRAEFIARCIAELKKPGVNFNQAAKNLKTSTVTLWRATGGKGRVLRGEAWNGPALARAKKAKAKVRNTQRRKSIAKSKPKAKAWSKTKRKTKAA